MSKLDIIRAWKDEEYANSLTDVQRAMLPENPAGFVELTEQDLAQTAGGTLFTIDIMCSLMFSCITLCIPTELPAN
ncbi:MAG TPA: mersacidin/lichenicidin family type 2 lantibiotic [Pyrinomonadaceae bacterium]|nr:mersacidin/lichenicidin family type 2 lantibiotic [Pyrinomonadaceae bacterium]